jgi:hypothetical protein
MNYEFYTKNFYHIQNSKKEPSGNKQKKND